MTWDFLYAADTPVSGALSANVGSLTGNVTISLSGIDPYYYYSSGPGHYYNYSVVVPSASGSYTIGAPSGLAVSDTWYVRLEKAGTTYTGWYSVDGYNWIRVTSFTFSDLNPTAFGLYAVGSGSPTPVTASFDSFTTSTGDSVSCPGESAGDTFDGATLDTCRWNQIQHEDAPAYNVSGGSLNTLTLPGDFWDVGTNYQNLFLQSAPTGDWWIQTKVTAPLNGNYAQMGLLAWQDEDHFVKLDPISQGGSSTVNTVEIQTEDGPYNHPYGYAPGFQGAYATCPRPRSCPGTGSRRRASTSKVTRSLRPGPSPGRTSSGSGTGRHRHGLREWRTIRRCARRGLVVHEPVRVLQRSQRE